MCPLLLKEGENVFPAIKKKIKGALF